MPLETWMLLLGTSLLPIFEHLLENRLPAKIHEHLPATETLVQPGPLDRPPTKQVGEVGTRLYQPRVGAMNRLQSHGY